MKKNNLYSYDILDNVRVNVKIEENLYDIPPEILFNMAARKNKKRKFLFVSKVLGKHIPVNPKVSLLGGFALAAKYLETVNQSKYPQIEDVVSSLKYGENIDDVYKEIKENPLKLPESTLFIGFAETATALGHAVFSSFKDNAKYIHTTRDMIVDLEKCITFEEEHSHATSHRVYPIDFDMLNTKDPIVFVDDEITTGKTVLNIIESIHSSYPREKYAIVSILDWRKHKDKELFKKKEEELGIKIETISLMSGSLEIEEKETDVKVEKLYLDSFFKEVYSYPSVDSEGKINQSPYLKYTGRFSIDSKEQNLLNEQIKEAGAFLENHRKGKKTLCMGTGEFIYIPMEISAQMGEDVYFQSTTRSPIFPREIEEYGAKNAFAFQSPDDASITNYFYNIPYGYYDDLYLFLEREVEHERIKPLMKELNKLGIEKIYIVFFTRKEKTITEPERIGSYSKEDAIFLLKDISGLVEEQGNEEREKLIQSGVHYSEMLPIEYKPSDEYMKIFYESLKKYDKKIAISAGVVAERIIKKRGNNIVLVSLARAGTPAGILIKRYLKNKYKIELPHYSISIIRGKGIDENAIRYILERHPDCELQFIDGWTGKGAITNELRQACIDFEKKWGVCVNGDLAVLADPANCTSIFGTREDFMIPSACLNATVSGLISRTVHREDLIGENEFHGAKYYKELQSEDVSNLFVDTISKQFDFVITEIEERLEKTEEDKIEVSWLGLKDVNRIQKEFDIDNIHLVKPGIGETTRVLLRRVPWKILISDKADNIEHILQLAKERNVPVEKYDLKAYQCCGIVKQMRRK